MIAKPANKQKILNDPIYGFTSITNDLLFELIEHPYFQRLRRISQLGLTYLVYPGAYHTRFHHAIGAMHLMQTAITSLQNKGHEITNDEKEAALIAILLHDIGHGPFSHALEHSIVDGVCHEDISSMIMKRLNEEFNGKFIDEINFCNTQKNCLSVNKSCVSNKEGSLMIESIRANLPNSLTSCRLIVKLKLQF